MQTDELILTLANQTPRVRRGTAGLRMLLGLVAGAAVSAALMLWRMGLRPDLATASAEPFFWIKWAFTAGLALAAGVMALRLARPGSNPRLARRAVVAVFAIMAALALAQLAMTPRAEWMASWMGHTARICPFNIIVLAAPVFIGLLWAMRSLAPTELRWAGWAAGLTAGGVGATIYALHCDESTAPFMATWYSLGILTFGSIGALLGPRILRW